MCYNTTYSLASQWSRVGGCPVRQMYGLWFCSISTNSIVAEPYNLDSARKFDRAFLYSDSLLWKQLLNNQKLCNVPKTDVFFKVMGAKIWDQSAELFSLSPHWATLKSFDWLQPSTNAIYCQWTEPKVQTWSTFCALTLESDTIDFAVHEQRINKSEVSFNLLSPAN